MGNEREPGPSRTVIASAVLVRDEVQLPGGNWEPVVATWTAQGITTIVTQSRTLMPDRNDRVRVR